MIKIKVSVVTIVPMSMNRIFSLKFGERSSHLVNVAYADKSWLWHLRYDHLNFNILKFLTSKSLVFGLLKVQEYKEPCEACAKGKHARESFSKGK